LELWQRQARDVHEKVFVRKLLEGPSYIHTLYSSLTEEDKKAKPG